MVNDPTFILIWLGRTKYYFRKHNKTSDTFMDLPDRTHNKYKPLKSIIVYRWFNIFKILNLLKPVEKFFFRCAYKKNEKMTYHLKNKCTKFQQNMINFKLSRPVKRFYSDILTKMKILEKFKTSMWIFIQQTSVPNYI